MDSGVGLKSESPPGGAGDGQENDNWKEEGEISESDTEDGGVKLRDSSEIDDSYYSAHLATLVHVEGETRDERRNSLPEQ